MTEFFGAINPISLSEGNWLNISHTFKPAPILDAADYGKTQSAQDSVLSTDTAKVPKAAFDSSLLPLVGLGIAFAVVALSFVF